MSVPRRFKFFPSCFPSQAYYAPCSCRNLVVLTGAQAIKINFASEPDNLGNFIATGVTYSSANKTYVANINKEVIVSGGTFNTPQILELSGAYTSQRPICGTDGIGHLGIGNKTIVSRAGVTSLVDLSGVGENLQDHMSLMLKPMELASGYA